MKSILYVKSEIRIGTNDWKVPLGDQKFFYQL